MVQLEAELNKESSDDVFVKGIRSTLNKLTVWGPGEDLHTSDGMAKMGTWVDLPKSGPKIRSKNSICCVGLGRCRKGCDDHSVRQKYIEKKAPDATSGRIRL